MASNKEQQGTLLDVPKDHTVPPAWMNDLFVKLASVVQGPDKPGFIATSALRIGEQEWLPADKHRLTVCSNNLRRLQYKAPILTIDGEPTGREISLAAIQLNPYKGDGSMRMPHTSNGDVIKNTMFYVTLRKDGKALKAWSGRRAILYNGSRVVKLFDNL